MDDQAMVRKSDDRARHVFYAEISNSIHIPTDCRISLENAPWRPRLGEIITVQDEMGRHFRGRVLRISGSGCDARLFEVLRKRMESPLHILLLQSLPDKERMEWIIQKATELGVSRIVPFFTKRSITLEDREKRQRKAHRWPVVAQKAAKQCRRAEIPVLEPYTDFQNALSYANGYDMKIILWEKEREQGLNRVLSNDVRPDRICVLIGPEGGFTEREIEWARAKGFLSIGLGPRILRTETATIAVIAILQHLWGDLT
jgi:16S rRNA (uracil1498-N3)-methyltransferase